METLGADESGEFMERFPNIELSYETISHKKVPNTHNIALAIPHGKKYFAWFSFYHNRDVLYFIELNKDKKITKIRWIPCNVDIEISIGTLFYGVLLDDSIFIIEDILSYRGFPMKNATLGEKLPHIRDFLSKYGHCCRDVVQFYLPAMWVYKWDADANEDDAAVLPLQFRNLPYNVHHIQYRALCEIVPLLNYPVKHIVLKSSGSPTITNSKRNRIDSTNIQTMRALPQYNKPQYKFPTVFQVSADIKFDIYHLFAYGKQKTSVYYDLAYIPNYKTSVFMNRLFRNMKENENLDAIEESDDECDFQNTSEDKYVDLEKTIFMECKFHPKFKRWTPMRVVSPPCKIIHVSML
jgi:hypothetical protein